MGALLFSPDGRIGKDAFLKGAVILLAFNFVLWLTWYIGPVAGFLGGVLAMSSVYCWACLFIKRLHDAGHSGGYFLIFLPVFLIIVYFLGSILTGVLSPEIAEVALEIQNLQKEDENPDPNEIMELAAPMFSAMRVPFAASFLITGFAIAKFANAILKPDGPNRFD